ncbi:MAG TPA: hypothetical protein VFO60_10585, partial [Candidatus Dormibacteraeota bacterium]|nr:hypothetical protein [Candidatus Dormibacteraeota bacterium]
MTSEPADALSGLQAEARRLEEVASRAEEALAATRAGIEEVRAQRARLIWERTEDPDELTRTLEELSARIEGLERAERSREVESIEART